MIDCFESENVHFWGRTAKGNLHGCTSGVKTSKVDCTFGLRRVDSIRKRYSDREEAGDKYLFIRS